jgi:hypothetical protein
MEEELGPENDPAILSHTAIIEKRANFQLKTMKNQMILH